MTINYKNLTTRAFLNKYFELINIAQPNPDKMLTPSEIELLTEFFLLPEKFDNMRFGSIARTKVQKTMEERANTKITRGSINNKISSLAQKGYLYRDEDGVTYAAKYLTKGVKEGLQAYEVGNKFSITFEFSYDKEGSKALI